MDCVKTENLLPKSYFYKWKKSIFLPDYNDEDLEDREDQYPLNHLGAAGNYQYQNWRNIIVREDGHKLAHRYSGLKPQRESQKKDFDMFLDVKDDEKDDNDAFLQSELRVKEK